MANTAQARKRARQSVERNKHNSSLRSMLRTAIKRVRQSIAAGDKAAAGEVFQKATSVIDRVADKNIIHKNKAARHKSRLAAAIKALACYSAAPVPGVMNTAIKRMPTGILFHGGFRSDGRRACPGHQPARHLASLLAHRRGKGVDQRALRPVFGIHRIHPERERARQRPHLQAIADEVERRQRIDDGHAQPLAHEGADRHG